MLTSEEEEKISEEKWPFTAAWLSGGEADILKLLRSY